MSPRGHRQPCPIWFSSMAPSLPRLLGAASSQLSLPCQDVAGLRLLAGVT